MTDSFFHFLFSFALKLVFSMETHSNQSDPQHSHECIYSGEEKISPKMVLPSTDRQLKGALISFKRFLSSLFCCGSFQERDLEELKNNFDTTATAAHVGNKTETYEPLGCLPGDDVSQNSRRTSIYNSKDIIPLRKFLRYTITPHDGRKFHCRRMLNPAKAIYEVEWEKDKWLQLDHATNKYIERLRVSGFSKVAIRNDKHLNKYISYDNPSQIDILLELSLESNDQQNNKQKKRKEKKPRPITCHQPSSFSVRRTQWWRTSHQVAEAHLPSWVDPDLCCNDMMMNAPSVMAVMTNFSRSSSCYFQQQKFPDTPAISQNSSMSQSPCETPSIPIAQPSPCQFKSLKYTNPPVLMNTPSSDSQSSTYVSSM